MEKIILISIVIITFLSESIAPAEKLIFATTEWPPYIIVKNREPVGPDMEIIIELCRRLNVKPEFQFLPWRRALKYAKEGKVDAIFAPRKTEKRTEFLYYPSEPLHIEKTVIMALKGSGIKAEPDDLKGRLTGIVRGYVYGPEFDAYKGLKKLVCDDDRQILKLLAKKRIELAVSSDERTMQYLSEQTGVELEVISVLNRAPSYLAFSKATGRRGKILAERFGEALGRLKKEGVVGKIESKYFSE